ncbi:MAG: hypothetical protein WCI73_09030, partial [Phycisphaerae bacterium]
LAKLAKDCGAASWQAVPTRAYPRWLDCFDNAGPGIWYGGGGADSDIRTEFAWMQQRGLSYCFCPPKESRYVAPGVLDTTQTDWFRLMCAKYDIPFRTLIWDGQPSWVWNREPLPYVLHAPGYVPGGIDYPNHSEQTLYTVPYGAEPVSASDRYHQDFRRMFSADVGGDPRLLGSMGVPECGVVGVHNLAAVAGMPETKAYWHSYLVHVVGLDLPNVGLQHHGRRDYYKSWEQVEVPAPRDFIGLDADSVDLTGMWEGRADREMKGVAAKWYVPESMPQDGWTSVHCNDQMLFLYRGEQFMAKKLADYWLRKTISLTAAQVSQLKYLYMARVLGHGGETKYCDVYVNGQPVKQVSPDSVGFLCFEVGAALRTGDNQFVLRMEGRPPTGTVALTARPYRPYPYMTEPENRLWYDASNFSAWLRARGAENKIRAMRAADPDRPLKLMATGNWMDMSVDLCERYGAYLHDTGGAAGYWCPMSGGRLSKTHGLPWSCEQGGPPNSAAELQTAMTFYLMLGNDAVDLVFATTHYKDKPDVAAWVDQNLELIKCVGKMHLPTPKIGMLRSTRVTRLGFGEPWNWDLARGAMQTTGRNFSYLEIADILNGTIDQFPVVMDCGTVMLTEEDIEGIRRYVERGGIFVAQHTTGRHSPEKGDTWPLARSLGLRVTPKWMTDENFHKWPLAKITFGQDQDLLPSLRGRTIEGSGVAIDFLGNEHSGAVAYAPDNAGGKNVRPVATWAEDGSMAIAEARLGRGRIILLGTPFYTRMRDEAGRWIFNDDASAALLDDFLAALGVPRDSWAGAREKGLWAEIWRSKNGVYDLYPVARMNKLGATSLSAEVSLRCATPVDQLVEVSALGHPKVKVAWQDGKMTLPAADYGQMQTRVFIAPRAQIARSGLDWFRAQAQIWRALPPLPTLAKPQPAPVPEDVIPAADGWRMSTGEVDAAWMQPEFADAGWKSVKLGSFATLDLPEGALARFRTTIAIPPAWQGRRINLNFTADWGWGMSPQGRLWIDGQPAKVSQPIIVMGDSSFSLDVTELAKDGRITLALEVDGGKLIKGKPQQIPAGVTGIFTLLATPATVATTPLAGPWFAAQDVGVLTPAPAGQAVKYVYLETRFTLPKEWPAKRVFLESPVKLQWLFINEQVIKAPLNRLDVSGLLRKDGVNVLRWVPGYPNPPAVSIEHTGPVPELNLVWTN